MLLITNKVRIAIKNEVVAKQKRILHDMSIFDVEIQKFIGVVEFVTSGQLILIVSSSGSQATFSYTYQGNRYTYWLNVDQISEFIIIAQEKKMKMIKHEI